MWPSSRSQLLRYFAATAALWSVVALLFASEGYLSGLYRGRPVDLAATLGYSFAFYGTWALLTPLVVLLARRWSFSRDGRWSDLARHAAASVGIALLQAGVFAFLFWPVYGPGNGYDSPLDLWTGMAAAHFPSNVLIYAVIAGGILAWAAHIAAQEREAQAARLQARLRQSELDALRAQIHPHFLFNTLHGIAALVRKDPRAAERLIAKLGVLLRAALEQQQRDRVPLDTEIGFVRDYLDIEGARFGDRLHSTVTVGDDTAGALVPPLLLQPLVENAVRHGLAPSTGAVTIRVAGGRRGDALTLEVSDDGAGADPDTLSPGIGLGNVKARLEQMFGDAQTMRIETETGGGFSVVLELPFQQGADIP